MNLYLDGIPTSEWDKHSKSPRFSKLLNGINEIFHEWDSAGIKHEYYHEYEPEANRIILVLMNNPDISVDELANAIHKIFVHMLEDSYYGTLDECIGIAEKILRKPVRIDFGDRDLTNEQLAQLVESGEIPPNELPRRIY